MASPQWYNERVRNQLSKEISWTIANEVRDPRIPSMLTIVKLKLSPDTRDASVFISLYGEPEELADAVDALNHAAPFIQKNVARKVKIKHFPKLHFKKDLGLRHSEHINKLLNEVKDDLV